MTHPTLPAGARSNRLTGATEPYLLQLALGRRRRPNTSAAR